MLRYNECGHNDVDDGLAATWVSKGMGAYVSAPNHGKK